jgi:hypothetical protein
MTARVSNSVERVIVFDQEDRLLMDFNDFHPIFVSGRWKPSLTPHFAYPQIWLQLHHWHLSSVFQVSQGSSMQETQVQGQLGSGRTFEILGQPKKTNYKQSRVISWVVGLLRLVCEYRTAFRNIVHTYFLRNLPLQIHLEVSSSRLHE